MRTARLIPVLLLAAMCGSPLGQTNKSDNIRTTGACSPVVNGNNNTFHFEYCGNDPEQGRKLAEILKAVSDSNEKLNAVMAAIQPPKILISKAPQEVTSPSKHPAWSFEFFLDRADDNAQFSVLCDRACNPLSICTLQGPNSGVLGHLASNPDVAVFLFERQLPALIPCVISVESADDKPIKILSISHISITDGRMLVLNQTQPSHCAVAGGTSMC